MYSGNVTSADHARPGVAARRGRGSPGGAPRAQGTVHDGVGAARRRRHRRGDAAVRELSTRLDGWSPASFRLEDEEIRAIVRSVPDRTIDDIGRAQAQIRRFAEAQLAALLDIEIETIPGVVLWRWNIPV